LKKNQLDVHLKCRYLKTWSSDMQVTNSRIGYLRSGIAYLL